ncbi:MAG: hypothetical protein WBL39_21965, partial [Terrimicrobiaceae bacterium]
MSEHRTHFGEPMSGGGIGPDIVCRAESIWVNTQASSSAVHSSYTRSGRLFRRFTERLHEVPGKALEHRP